MKKPAMKGQFSAPYPTTKVLPLYSPRVTKILLFLMPDNFTLSIARGFYLSKGDPLGVKGLKQEKMFLSEKTVYE